MQEGSWRKGPLQTIICSPAHDRPIFALAMGQGVFVTGSADHGLREYSLETGKHIRELFAPKFGHKEWVTTCTYTPDGQIVSGAMDSVVCLWDRKGKRCDHFLGHKASVSKVAADHRLALSASYDASIILWNISNKSQTHTLQNVQKEPIMEFEWQNSLLVSGDKGGVVCLWDLNKAKIIKSVRTHKGAVSSIKVQKDMLLTGGLNDGVISCTDMRTNQGIYHRTHHKGSLNWLRPTPQNLLLSCSADGYIKACLLNDWRNVLDINAQDMVFCVEQVKDVIIGSTAKGNILAYDANTGDNLYGYGVMKKGGCRIIRVDTHLNRLVCVGEDQAPTLLVYK